LAGSKEYYKLKFWHVQSKIISDMTFKAVFGLKVTELTKDKIRRMWRSNKQ
jgi:hypothetical protein